MLLRLRYKHHPSKSMTLRLEALRVPVGEGQDRALSPSLFL